MKKALIIGAGISGICAARILAEAGFSVIILEKRDHIAGNIYDYYEDGVLVHKYGPHLFHTTRPDVAEFVERFAEFVPYEHKVLGEIQGKLVPIPFNFQSMDILFTEEKSTYLKAELQKAYPDTDTVPILELRKHMDPKIQELAEFVYQNVFYGYTVKQWGKEPSDLDPYVMGRVPVRLSYDDRYFKDPFQKIPKYGYTYMVENILRHPNIALRLNCEAFEHIVINGDKLWMDGELWDGPVIYTGRIEELFGFRFGKLPYRSLKFSFEKHNVEQYQPVVQVNYPNQYTYTRISEFKILQQSAPKDHTIIVYEYPIPCSEGDIPYYPIASKENAALYGEYVLEAKKIRNLYLLGRLAEYRYFNMDQAIAHALEISEEIKREY